MRLGILASGNLGCSVLKYLRDKYDVVFVMTDKNSLSIINLCEEYNFPYYSGNPRKGRSKEFIQGKKIDVLVSVNYLFIIEEDLIKLPEKLAFNIHGSLLPKYRGRTPHVWAIINNEKVTGITAHIIDSGCDTGDIIEQIEVEIDVNDTGATILKKYEKLYIPLIDSVLLKVKDNKLQFISQDTEKASFFGKRNPEDGKINWEWQKERIWNWVRAQAHPYPGAFAYYHTEKVIIDEICFVDHTFNYEMPNGLILCSEPLKVKTPNGVIEIKKIRNQQKNFIVGDLLN
ncbi:methionyl-tRNA formyltransferase [Christiangramia aquimixticola]|uniref:methionyl-tRNA formyltransferase n=1 Tax=Christiangramia aquimixticola TaxID=1697558 RepID=UPI003AA96FC0